MNGIIFTVPILKVITREVEYANLKMHFLHTRQDW